MSPAARLGAAAAGGLVASLSLPPVGAWPAMLVGLAVLAAVLRDAPSARSAALTGLMWGTTGGIVGMRFVVETVERFTGLGIVVALLALLVLAAGQGLAWGVGAAAVHVLRRRARVPFELAFAGGVFLAGVVPAMFAWTPAAIVAPHRPELVQLASVVGERGVSALLALIVAVAVRAVPAARRPADARRLRAVAAPLAIALVALVLLDRAGTAMTPGPPGGPAVRVALLDHDAPPRFSLSAVEQDAAIARLRRMSERADRAAVDLIVWPEASYPLPLRRGSRRLGGGTATPVSADARAPRLFGLQTFERGGGTYNSATIVEPDGRLQPPTDKRKLLWFGETTPLADVIPPLRGVLSRKDITPAERSRPLLVRRSGGPPVRLGVLICYEDVGPNTGVAIARETRPQLLVNITNDAWFAGTIAPRLQADLAVMRAIELRTPLVRAVNGGSSAYVDAAGRRRAAADDDQRGAQTLFVTAQARPAGAPLSFYARAGDVPLWVALGLLVGGCAVVRRRPA